MKSLLYLLFALSIIPSINSQTKDNFGFIKYQSDGSYSIPNQIGNRIILPNYKNFKDKSDSIYIEKIEYYDEKDNCFLIIGDLSGSRSSLILFIKEDHKKFSVIFSEEIAPIDTLKKVKLNNFTFFLLTSQHTDMCSKEKGLSIYLLNNSKLYKSFFGLEKKEFYNSGDPLCLFGISYTKKFNLIETSTGIELRVKKEIKGKKSEFKIYRLNNYQFK
jgi:hypothetical protein